MSKSATLFRPSAALAWFHAFALAGMLWAVMIGSAALVWRAYSGVPSGHAEIADPASIARP